MSYDSKLMKELAGWREAYQAKAEEMENIFDYMEEVLEKAQEKIIEQDDEIQDLKDEVNQLRSNFKAVVNASQASD
jgi:archaellum component FlaC